MRKVDFFLHANEHAPVLDTELRFAFFSHNKVAQTSINRNLLSGRAIVQKDSISNWDLALSRSERYWERRQPFVFTVVRNPYSRSLSAFFYLRKIGKIPNHLEFNEFMQSTFLHAGPEFDPHFEPQEKFSSPINEMGFDIVIKMEDISKEWTGIASMIGAPLQLPQSNRTLEEKSFSSIDVSTRRIIEAVYERDFSGLGYDRISSPL